MALEDARVGQGQGRPPTLESVARKSVVIFEACFYKPDGHMDNGQPLALADGYEYEDQSSDQQSVTRSITSSASATSNQQRGKKNNKER
eukprot:scaffold39595_cov57-Phaeocystis_antarctica.AAC.1